MKTIRLLALILLAAAIPVTAQVPSILVNSIGAPGGSPQEGARLGVDVVAEGPYIVAGAADDDAIETDSGVVKVFDSATGALLHVLVNPSPAKDDNFGISLAISGTRLVVGASGDDEGNFEAGMAYVYDLSSGTPTVPVLTLNNPTPSYQDSFGYSVAIVGTTVAVGALRETYGADDSGAVYVYDITGATPTIPTITIGNPTPDVGDLFGQYMAMSGTRLVVSTIGDNHPVEEAGVVYVYDLSSATPTVPAITLLNPSPAVGDYFGFPRIDGDIVAVGVPLDDTGATDSGRVYIYNLASGTPSVPVKTLNNPSPTIADWFGIRVAVSGTRVVVGAYLDNAGANDSGTAYVYDLNSPDSTPLHTLNNPTPAVNDQYGWWVAAAGDRVLVSALMDDTQATDAGSVYEYNMASLTPTTPVRTLNQPSPSSGDNFGHSVSISGSRVAVGAWLDNTGASDAGSVSVYDLSSGTPNVPVARLNNPAPAAQDYFGVSVGIAGTRVVVGAREDDTGAAQAGSAYVYDLATSTTTPILTLNNPTPAVQDQFGQAVDIAGTMAVVGAYLDDTGATNAGTVYVYDVTSGTPTVPVRVLNNPAPGVDDRFGLAVAISGTRVLVGAHGNSTGASGAGSAYVYDLSSGTPTVPTHVLDNPAPAVDDNFALAVDISGTRVVIGAYYDDAGGTNAGSAYVYDLAGPSPTVPVATLNNPDPAANDEFGRAVSISGTRVVVGAYQDDVGANDTGTAYVYEFTSSTPAVPVATLRKSNPILGDKFGTSVGITGTTVVVGAPFDDSVMPDKGALYVFGPNPNDEDNDGLLDSWELTYWPTITGHGPLDDEDKDGIVNLLELAFDLNPTQGNGSPLPPAVDEGGYLTLTLTKQPGVTYVVQSAGTLLPLMPDSFSAASTTVLLDNAATLKVRDNVLMSTPGGRFMRVQVTAAP